MYDLMMIDKMNLLQRVRTVRCVVMRRCRLTDMVIMMIMIMMIMMMVVMMMMVIMKGLSYFVVS